MRAGACSDDAGWKTTNGKYTASPTGQTAGVEMAVLDPTGILAGAGMRGSMATMHGVLAARAGKVCLHACRPDMCMQGWSGWGELAVSGGAS